MKWNIGILKRDVKMSDGVDSNQLKTVAKAALSVIARTMGIEPEDIELEILPHMRGISIFLHTDYMYGDTIKFLHELMSSTYGPPQDGRPTMEVTIRAHDTKENHLDNYEWMKKNNPKEWKEILKYEYNGMFEVEIEVAFSENDWNGIYKKE